jgi:multidrug efflux pump subunit AcrA (membrane-fusion protein)
MFEFMKKRRITVIAVIVIVFVIVAAIKIDSNGAIETVSPVFGDLIRTVKISGKVVPKESAELGFETSGTISNIFKQVGDSVRRGDIIVKIDASGISSSILKAEAELALAQAELYKLDGAGVYEARIDNAKQALIQTIIDAYTYADDAIYNKTDQFFIEPNSDRPDIAPTFEGYPDLRNSINNGRISVGKILETWNSLISGLNTTKYTDIHLAQSKKYLSQISAYIADVSRAVNLFEASVVFSQTTIDVYQADTILARNNLNSASQDLISSEDNLKGLLLEVPVQIARLETARASLLNYRTQLSKTSIISPINGIISKQDAKVGQVVSSASNLVSVISQDLEVESFIPEILISGVAIDNMATITLDAYRDTRFEGKVMRIDPAETIHDGVSTYRTRLSFAAPHSIIRSGMTANIEIQTYRKATVTLIPERTVIRENNETFIYILDGNSKKKIPVIVGERDSTGNVELITSVASSSKIIINPTEN